MRKRPVAKYEATHQWVWRNFGKANHCEHCTGEGAKAYHWANISGEYRRIREDWKQLCVRCHLRFDGRTKEVCKNGHRWADEKPYIRNNKRYCMGCRRIASTKYNRKKAATKRAFVVKLG